MKYLIILFLVALFSSQAFSQTPKPKATPHKTLVAKTKTPVADEKPELEKALAETDLALKIEALQKFIAAFPKSAEKIRAQEILVSSRAQLAEEKLRAADASGGIELFKKAVADVPQPVSDKLFSEVILQFPTNLFYRGEQAAATEVARMIEEKIGGNAKQLLGLATFYLGTENVPEARRIAGKAIAIDANSPVAYQTLALANRLDFRLEESAADYAKAAELDPNSAVSRRSLAEMKRALGKTDEAAAIYRELLEKNADDTAAQTGLTLALFDAEKQPEAEAELAKSLGKNPNNLILLTGAAYWYAAHNDGAKASDLAQKAVALEPRYTWAHIALARALLAQKQPLEAEKTLLAARQYGNFPTLDYEIAAARLAAGFYEEAALELKKSFTLSGNSLQTRLGNRVPKDAPNFIELLALERRAGIFEPLAADNPNNAERLKVLLSFNQKLAAPDAKDEEIEQAADAFVKGDDAARTHRLLYAANRLLQAKRNLPKILELAQAATVGVDAALEVPNASAAVLADELFESRQLALTRGEVVNVPEIPRQTLSAILRGRIEEITGWTLFNQEKPQEAVVRLKRAVSVLPEKSAWWRSSVWRLGAAQEASGKPNEALDAYIKSYTSAEPDAVKRPVIESLYQKINGNLDGLDDKIGAKPVNSNPLAASRSETKTEAAKSDSSTNSAAAVSEMRAGASEKTPEVSPTAAAETIEAKQKTNPATANPTATNPKTESAAANPAPDAGKPLFGSVVITVPKTETAKSAKNAKTETDSCRLSLSEESVTISANGGKIGVLAGFDGDAAKIVAASGSPNDIDVSLEPDIGKQSNRAFFVIKSVSAKTGVFTVTFDSPCGKKEVSVTVR